MGDDEVVIPTALGRSLDDMDKVMYYCYRRYRGLEMILTVFILLTQGDDQGTADVSGMRKYGIL